MRREKVCEAPRGTLSHAITAEHRPALEHLLVPCFPLGIVGLKRKPWINHHGQLGAICKADGNARKIGGSAEADPLNRQASNLWELDQPGISDHFLWRGTAGLPWGFACWLFFQGAASFGGEHRR